MSVQIEEATIEAWQAETECRIEEYKNLRDAGHITESEYQELAQDVINIASITQKLELEDSKIKVQKAVDAIKVFAGLL